MSYQAQENTRVDLERRALHAFGRLEGRLSYASPALLRRFAFASLREILVRSLEDAGFMDATLGFDRWLAGGPPLQSCPGSEAPAEAYAAVILRYLKQASWPDLAEASELLARAAPHLSRGEGAQALEPIVDQAQHLVTEIVSRDGAEEGDPVHFLGKIADQARAHPAFAPGRREDLPLDIEGAQHLIPTAAPRAASWALNLVIGEGFAAARMLPIALPLPRAVTPETLRADLPQNDRGLALARSVLASLDHAFVLLDRARQSAERVAPSLRSFRPAARAPVAELMLSELGPLSVAQLVRALSATRRGVISMLQPLEVAGLVTRIGVRWQARANSAAMDARVVPAGSMVDAAQEVDAALARLDALLSTNQL